MRRPIAASWYRALFPSWETLQKPPGWASVATARSAPPSSRRSSWLSRIVAAGGKGPRQGSPEDRGHDRSSRPVAASWNTQPPACERRTTRPLKNAASVLGSTDRVHSVFPLSTSRTSMTSEACPSATTRPSGRVITSAQRPRDGKGPGRSLKREDPLSHAVLGARQGPARLARVVLRASGGEPRGSLGPIAVLLGAVGALGEDRRQVASTRL